MVHLFSMSFNDCTEFEIATSLFFGYSNHLYSVLLQIVSDEIHIAYFL
jgi:hypothetical protein